MSDDDTWKVDPESYTIRDVAEKAQRFFFDGKIKEVLQNVPKEGEETAKKLLSLGMIIAGYSTGSDMGEEWCLEVADGVCNGPVMLRKINEIGIKWEGMVAPICRLINGFDPQLEVILREALVDENEIGPLMNAILQPLRFEMALSAMPIKDTIDLAEFLADLTIKFFRFKTGAPVVGGPIDIAAITKHEGFNWIQRKWYYQPDINPEVRYASE